LRRGGVLHDAMDDRSIATKQRREKFALFGM